MNKNSRQNVNGSGAVTPPTIKPNVNQNNNNESKPNSNKKPLGYADKDYDYSKVVSGLTKDNLKDEDINGYVKYFGTNKSPSYYNPPVQDIKGGIEDGAYRDFNNLVHVSAMSKNYFRGKLPPSYADNILYDHRESALLSMHSSVSKETQAPDINNIFRLGDCMFVIPPEYISITSNSSHEDVQVLRQNGSIKTKHGYVNDEIVVNLPINGMNQINGYEVTSPFAYPYFLDGLRPLIAQFKAAPFVPVQNSFLNITNKVHTVAMKAMIVETVQGYPEHLNVQLILDNFNAVPYIGADNCLFDNFVNWDLFRFYYQQYMVKELDRPPLLPPVDRSRLNGLMKLSVLKQEVLDGTKTSEDADEVDLTKDENYECLLDNDKHNFSVTYMSFSMSNIMPSIQMSNHEAATKQYLGYSDINFSINVETTDEAIAMRFKELNRRNQNIVRNHPYANGIGFIKVENELINMTGTRHCIVDSVQVTTVPNFPGTFNIALRGVSFDTSQKDKEKLYSFSPVKSKRPTEKDLISLQPNGVKNKLYQDCIAEQSLEKVNLYPDLLLPTYSKVNYALRKIDKFREKHGLRKYDYIIHPPMTGPMPGNPLCKDTDKNSGMLVDPDFYMCYPHQTTYKACIETSDEMEKMYNGNKTKNTSNGSKKDVNKFKTYVAPITPDEVTQPIYKYGYEPSKVALHKGGEVYKEDEELKEKRKNILLGRLDKEVGNLESNVTVGDGKAGDATKDPKDVPNRVNIPFVDLILDRCEAGCGYVFGSHGEIATREFCDRMIASYPNFESTVAYKWIGKQVFDCSGIISWAMRRLGMKPDGWRSTDTGLMSLCTPVSKSNLQMGDLCQKSGHIGIYFKDGITIEAMNTEDGVKYGRVDQFYNFGRLVGLEEANERARNNPNFYTKTTDSSTDSNGNNVRTLSSGSNKQTRTPNNQQARVPNHSGNTQNRPSTNLQSLLNPRMHYPGRPVLGKLSYSDAKDCDKWDSLILKHAATWNVDPNFLKCLIYNESRGNPQAGPNAYNCWGLCQVNADYYKVRGGNYYDPEANIEEGFRIFFRAGLNPHANFDIDRWITGFNCGEG